MFLSIYIAATCVFLTRYSNARAGAGYYPLSYVREVTETDLQTVVFLFPV